MRICDYCKELNNNAVVQYTEVKLEVRGADFKVDLCWGCVSSVQPEPGRDNQYFKMDFGRAAKRAAEVVEIWSRQPED